LGRDQASLPQPDKAGPLTWAGGAHDAHITRKTTMTCAVFFVFLLTINLSNDKGRIPHAGGRAQQQHLNNGSAVVEWITRYTARGSPGIQLNGSAVV